MTTAQVVEMSVTVNSNSPIQDYVHPNNQTQPTFGCNFIKNHSDFTVNTSLFLSPIMLSTGQITIQ